MKVPIDLSGGLGGIEAEATCDGAVPLESLPRGGVICGQRQEDGHGDSASRDLLAERVGVGCGDTYQEIAGVKDHVGGGVQRDAGGFVRRRGGE